MRAKRGIAVGLAVAGLAGAGAARGDTDFGTLGLGRTSFGSFVSLSTPSSRLFQESDEFIVHRTVVQSVNGSLDPGLIQVGVYRSGPGLQLDNCGTRAGYVIYTEVKQYGSLAYRCQLFQPVSPGTILNLDVFRFHTAATWGIRINGVLTGSVYRLGFNSGEPAVGSEIVDHGQNHGTHAATRYAPAGHAAWSFYAATARQGRRRVTAGPALFEYAPSDRFWKLPPPPARMTFRHRE
ncbi:MAG: hypothetical protein QOE44_2519 [Solirubrobacteraceae bacterium]|jgi:hypothetical protein|nr:hypothetical protein [Solirubrobacteraceae bacterium]